MSASGREMKSVPSRPPPTGATRSQVGSKAIIQTEPRTRINVRLPTAKLIATRTRLEEQRRNGELIGGHPPTLTAVLEQGLERYLEEGDDVEPL